MMALSRKYPGGLAALASLVMRLSLLLNVLHSARAIPTIWWGASLLIAAGLLAGLCTRLVALASMPYLVGATTRSVWLATMSCGQAGMVLALVLLGGGALSLDARLFGRRVIRVR